MQEYIMARIVVDAGHGGSDPGAVYQGRQEKDDNLRLALAVGQILADRGQEVIYTRTEDVYQTPFQKATVANDENADYFISMHRNSSPVPGQYNGAETLIYDDSGIKAQMARDINSGLDAVGFQNLGIDERPGLVVLRRTRMPALLVEAGFINSDTDNAIFDSNFDAMAQAIADGMLQSIEGVSGMQEHEMAEEMPAEMLTEIPAELEMNAENRGFPIYRVQTGAYRERQNAEELLYQLQQQGFPAFVILDDGYYKVQVGAFGRLDNAARMEAVLRRFGYNTYITV